MGAAVLANARVDTETIAEIRRNGFVVLKDFLPLALCAQLREQIDDITHTDTDRIWIDDAQSDHRIYGFDRLSGFNTIDEYLTRLQAAADLYMNERQTLYFALGARLVARPGNIGSGGGWHRDSVSTQFKSIIYLTDVDDSQGPFEIIPRSHRLASKIMTISLTNLRKKRFTEDEVERLESRSLGPRTTLTGTAGTVILADTSSLHRGKPIEQGERFTLTNYYMGEGQDFSKLDKKFAKYFYV